MKKFLVLAIIIFISLSVYSQDSIQVWKNKPPTSNGLADEAKLYVYLPENTADHQKVPAVLICPGGGYAGVSMKYEGHAFAQWLASQGIAGIVLKYRLPNQHKEVSFEDAEQSMQIIRANAERWNINPDKVGISGFSAGGHLAAILSNRYSKEGLYTHPNFTILFYPVISFEEVTKGGTRTNLLGKDPSSTEIYSFSADRQVTVNTPPTIIFVSDNDHSVPSVHSTIYYNALKRNGIPATLYVFPEGEHGWGMIESFKYYDQSLSLLKMWLDATVFDQ